MDALIWIWVIVWFLAVVVLSVPLYRDASREQGDARLREIRVRYVRALRAAVIAVSVCCSALILYVGRKNDDAKTALGCALIVLVASGGYAAVGAPQWVDILVYGARQRGARRSRCENEGDS